MTRGGVPIALTVLLALLVSPDAEAYLFMAHSPDERGLIDPEVAEDEFLPGEPFWITIQLPTKAGEQRTPVCLLWRSAQGEVLSRAVATLPAGEPLALTAPDTSGWRGQQFRLEVVSRQGAVGCTGPSLATARFALVTPPTAGPDGEPDPELPPFPWPPPKPTVRDVLPPDLLAQPVRPGSFGEVANRLLAALSDCGYHDRSFFGVPGGFAVATRLEQIEADGTPKPEPERWSRAVPAKKIFDLNSFLDALFGAPKGHYRVLVFVARVGSVPLSSEEFDRPTVEQWAIAGDLVLPPELSVRTWSDRHHVTVLVYQFETTGLHGEPTANPEGAPPAWRQLARSGLLAALTR